MTMGGMRFPSSADAQERVPPIGDSVTSVAVTTRHNYDYRWGFRPVRFGGETLGGSGTRAYGSIRVHRHPSVAIFFVPFVSSWFMSPRGFMWRSRVLEIPAFAGMTGGGECCVGAGFRPAWLGGDRLGGSGQLQQRGHTYLKRPDSVG